MVLLWLAVGHTVARAELRECDGRTGSSPSTCSTRRGSTRCRRAANENLTLVARGAVLTPDGTKDQYETDYGTGMKALGAQLGERGEARRRRPAGRAPGGRGRHSSVSEWQDRHKKARATDDQGDYDSALAQIIGPEDSTGESFDEVDAALELALAHEQDEFDAAAEDGRGALGGLPAGAAALAVLGAVAASSASTAGSRSTGEGTSR